MGEDSRDEDRYARDPDRDRPRLTLLANSRSTRCPEDLEALVEPLREPYQVEVMRVDDPTDFSRRIRQSAARSDVLLIGSGDGTFARSGNALIESGCVLGVLPFGNANDLARGLGIPLDLESACRALAEAAPVAVDVGRVNGHCFFSAATLGIGARISSGMDATTKKRWKRFSQLPNLLRAIRERRPFSLSVQTDRGLKRLRSVHATIANGRTIGGGLVIDPDATLDDAQLDFSSVRPQSGAELFSLAPAMIRGRRRQHPRIDFLSGRWMRIETSRRMEIATDGDVVTQTPAEFECLPGAVRFLVPRVPTDSLALSRDA